MVVTNMNYDNEDAKDDEDDGGDGDDDDDGGDGEDDEDGDYEVCCDADYKHKSDHLSPVSETRHHGRFARLPSVRAR